MVNAYSEVTETAMGLTNHSQQAANTTDTGSPLSYAPWNSRAENHGLLKPAPAQPASPATPKHTPSLSSFGSKGKLRFIKKVRKITLVLNSISAAILKLPRFYIKQ